MIIFLGGDRSTVGRSGNVFSGNLLSGKLSFFSGLITAFSFDTDLTAATRIDFCHLPETEWRTSGIWKSGWSETDLANLGSLNSGLSNFGSLSSRLSNFGSLNTNWSNFG